MVTRASPARRRSTPRETFGEETFFSQSSSGAGYMGESSQIFLPLPPSGTHIPGVSFGQTQRYRTPNVPLSASVSSEYL